MSSELARRRLAEERKQWRKSHPPGFFARPRQNDDATMNLMVWDCGVPGKQGTPWAGGVYPLTITFSDDYPSKPPAVMFPRGFFHVNVYEDGAVCLSILNEDLDWRPSITLKQILVGVQDLLDTPNISSAAGERAFDAYRQDKKAYARVVDEQVKRYTS